MMSKIQKIYAREILDSRGDPTVEVEVELESGAKGVAAVPSGASTGKYEAVELRDGDSVRYQGKGVLKAVENVNNIIAEALIGKDSENQKEIDKIMIKLDGTENKSKLGANAILGVSLAICRASANEQKIPLYQYISKNYKLKAISYKLPIPMFNILNGGKHSDSGLSIQEFKIIPTGIESFKEQLRAGSEIFHTLKKILEKNDQKTSVGDEGGFAPKLESNTQALELICQAIKEAGYKPGSQVNIGIDAAASSFYNEADNQYLLEPENVALSRESLINLYKEWIDKYNVISIEDGLNEDDWEGWAVMTKKIEEKTVSSGLFSGADKYMTIGDDFLVTNVKRLKKSIETKACNSILVKVNQIGTLSETIECMKLAQKNKMKVIVSHRSGETTDDFIADLAVGAGAEFIKSGSLSRGERICKYNRLMKIESELAN
ncbi:MAG: phosphopyruvate hydratase [Patescibacteria group bacterium]